VMKAERIRTVQATVCNLERLIFFLSSISNPDHRPVIPFPRIMMKRRKRATLMSQFWSLREDGRSIPTAMMATGKRSTRSVCHQFQYFEGTDPLTAGGVGVTIDPGASAMKHLHICV
jgi:hypothetical protein